MNIKNFVSFGCADDNTSTVTVVLQKTLSIHTKYFFGLSVRKSNTRAGRINKTTLRRKKNCLKMPVNLCVILVLESFVVFVFFHSVI